MHARTSPAPGRDPQRDDAVATAARLRLSATRLARRLRQQSDSGLTPTQLSALASIGRHGPMTLGALADHEQVSPPTVTRVVAKLETDGLVVKRVDARDRRVSHVEASEHGRRLLARSRARKNVWLATRLRALDDDERRRVADALDALDALVDREPPA